MILHGKFALKLDEQMPRAHEYYKIGASCLPAGDELAYAWAAIRAASAAAMVRLPGIEGYVLLQNCFADTLARHQHVFENVRQTPIH